MMSRSASCASQTRRVMRRESRTTVASRRHGVCGSALERSVSSRARRAYAPAAPASWRGGQAAWLVRGWRSICGVGALCRIAAAESSSALHRRARESVDRPWRLLTSLRSLGTGEDRLPLIASSNHFTVVIVAGGGHNGGGKMVHRPWGNRPILRRGLVGSNARARTPGWKPERERGGASDAPRRQSDLRREGRRFATATYAALVQDVAHVAAHRRRRNHETLADFPAGQPLRTNATTSRSRADRLRARSDGSPVPIALRRLVSAGTCDGSSSDSPRATSRLASRIGCGPVFPIRKPDAPARNAEKTASPRGTTSASARMCLAAHS